jgi:hypothetical protein
VEQYLKQHLQEKIFMSIFVQNAIRSLPVSRSLLIPADVSKDLIRDLILKSRSFRDVRIALKGIDIAILRAALVGASPAFF